MTDEPTNRDFTLRIDSVDPTELSRVYGALSAVSHGFMLDGLDVSLWSSPSADDDLFAELDDGSDDEALPG